MTQEELESKRTKCEVWSRVVGYIRPTQSYNDSKLAEYNDRVTFKIPEEVTS